LRSKAGIGLLLMLGSSASTRAQTWSRLGPEGGMVISLGASGAALYLGTADGHVFQSKDGANTWELRGRVGTRTDAVVTRLLVDTRENKRVFAAVWYQAPGAGGGVFQSEDEGRSWRLAGLEDEAVRSLETAPSQPAVLFAGTRSGVFRSRDHGTNWERISPLGDAELRNVDSLAIDPENPEIIYAGTYHLPWKTTDGGETWKPIPAGLIDDSDIMSLRIDTTNPKRIFLSACSGIYRSENHGAQWTKLQGIPYTARRTQVIVQDPGNPKLLYAGTTEGLWVTRDGGESWKQTTPTDWVVNAIAVLFVGGGRPGRVAVGTEQGIRVSDDAGESFESADRGFAHTVVKQLLPDARDPQHLLMLRGWSARDLLESRDAGQTWAAISAAIEEKNQTRRPELGSVEEAYASPWGWLVRLKNGQMWIWEDGKKNWHEWKLRLGTPSMSAQRNPVPGKKSVGASQLEPAGGVLAFTQPELYLDSRVGLVRCKLNGICMAVKAFSRSLTVQALWVNESGSKVAAVAGGRFAVSNDAGATAVWRDLPLAGTEVRWLAGGVGEKPAFFLGTDKGLYQSDDEGAQWRLIEGGLPAGRIERWLDGQKLEAATLGGGGMYLSYDRGTNWTRVDSDAERGRFSGLAEVSPETILAGSESEGLLRLNTGTVR
jgi:photosystem II stability/assembly factor-like uncharacterized protein